MAQLRAATTRAIDRYGADALAYGNPFGPPPLREFIAARLAETDARAPSVDEIVVTGGASQGLDLVATLFMKPNDAVLVAEPTYYLAMRLLADHPVPMHPVASDAQGVLLEYLAQAVPRLRRRSAVPGRGSAAEHRRVFLYLVPTFNNPTGTSLPDDRRHQLVQFAAEHDLLVIEDDTYRELAYDGPPPASLWAIAHEMDAPGTVVRLGSFAKSVAPGLRVGYITADAPTAKRIAACGLLDSGGSPSQFTALMLAEYAAAGDYTRGVEGFRAAYRERREALLGSLRAGVRGPDSGGRDGQDGSADGDGTGGLRWTRPEGGYFAWLGLPPGLTADGLREVAVGCGVDFMTASQFYLRPDRAPEAIRLSFSRYPVAVLEEAAARLATAIDRSGRGF